LYWEDADLCYRALKCGYNGIYEPQSIIWHDESTTFSRVYGRRPKNVIAHRNMFLFFWKNIDDPVMWLMHMAMIVPVIAAALLRNNIEFVAGFFKALPHLGSALARRPASAHRKKYYACKDKDLIRWNYR
jgi:GT2 family glycosyltransferase